MNHHDLPDFPDVVEQHFPYDGPHTDDTVLDALRGAQSLIRYANNATSRRGVLNGPSVYRSASAAAAMAHGLVQLLDQLADAARQVAEDPTAYDDRRDRPASQTAIEVGLHLDVARDKVAAVTRPLDQAAIVASHIGHDR